MKIKEYYEKGDGYVCVIKWSKIAQIGDSYLSVTRALGELYVPM